MKIAIASGKGGTGKTTLAVNLALYASETVKTVLADLDVEEPNGSLFIKGQHLHDKIIFRYVPNWNKELCTFCGSCSKLCSFNAIVNLGSTIQVLSNLCHSCFACSELCPLKALPMVEDSLGRLSEFQSGNLRFIESKLDVGKEMAAPLITKTINYISELHSNAEIQFWDCPPGTTCPVIAAVKEADFVILVTEPTPFGLYDLSLAVETMRFLNKPLAVVINRYDIGNDDVLNYCCRENVPVWAEIPNKRHIAELYSAGKIIFDKDYDFHKAIRTVIRQIVNIKDDFSRI